ncbi:MAG: hypothetical protein PVI30_16275 [Myxococcales bacterium]
MRCLIFALWLLCGCASRAPSGPAAETTVRAERAADAGARRAAAPIFVSPHSYEWFVRAEVLAARGDDRGAARAYEMALAGAEEDPYVLARLALARERLGDAHGADRAIARALALDARSEAAWLARAEIAERRDATREAMHALERAAAASPLSPEPPRALAALLQRLGRPERAVAVLQRFAARNPEGSDGAMRARLRLAIVRHDAARVAELGRALLRSDRRHGALAREAARELLDAGQPALALRLLRTHPQDAAGVRLRLRALLSAARWGEAEALLSVTPPEVLGGPLPTARALLEVGRPRRALSLLRELPEAQAAARHERALLRGRALLSLGRVAEAARELARVPPGSAHAGEARALLAQALEAGGLAELGRELTADAAVGGR